MARAWSQRGTGICRVKNPITTLEMWRLHQTLEIRTLDSDVKSVCRQLLMMRGHHGPSDIFNNLHGSEP